ncbi:glucose dehydrogenase [FAD, quinone]-like [Spodoptera litura]|uniref:Glucose dehydrogenase [FAD, quinone]-like n=1 Tax=Spodoptera litura TaxID=69820 RepID=A0A9J7ELM3_SPOLT|nr:glucose dehydrogenase [FAD, quinone]-like [Spodoptera litura]XP_022830932.1 glucose dehydrogenase [FAD, quinone]-like [Spodoptera litura]
MLSASTQISRVRQLQQAFSVLALLNINSNIYPEDATVSSGDMFDYVVVGGGTAGLVVTTRLVEANYSVLVIEAGDIPGVESLNPGLVQYIKNSRIDWNYTSELNCRTDSCLKADGGSFYGRGIGGTGILNYMIYGRGNERDYHNFSEATGDPSWEYKNMLKYFKKSEKLKNKEILNSRFGQFHGTKGEIGITQEDRPFIDKYLKGFEEAGEKVVIDNVGPGKGLGYSRCLYTIFNGKRNDAGSEYLNSIKDNPKLYVTRNSLATKIIFDKDRNAIGVEFVKHEKRITVRAKREILVTAGPVKSPQLLMLSGIGPKEELQRMKINVLSNLPVGKSLQCVVGAFIDFKTNIKANPPPFDPSRLPAPIILGYSAVNKSSEFPDYETQNFIIDDPAYFLTLCSFTLKLKNCICDRLLESSNNTQMMVSILLNINSKSRGSVSLRSTDPNDEPIIEYGFYDNEDDLNEMITNLQHYTKIENTPYFQDLGLEFMEPTPDCRKHEFGSRKYWRCYALCMIALTGRTASTCAMGSVVDTNLRVYGVNKLRVIGSTVMPNTLGGSIFAPEVALAEKAAEMIVNDRICT